MVSRAVRRTDSAPAGLVRVHRADRIDVSGLLPPQIQSDGSLLLDGYVARPGVLVYQNADGTSRRELVTRATLRDAAPSLGRKTLTLEHPDEDVSPETVAKVGVGDVDGEVVVYDDGYTRVKMAVRRGDAIEAFRGGVQELSPGYACDLDMTAGVDPEFGAYDAIQVRRDYNHVALCTRARGGPTIRARADSADVAIQASSSEIPMRLLANPAFMRILDTLKVPAARRVDEDGALAAAGEAAAAIVAATPALEAQAAELVTLRANVETMRKALTEAEAQLAKASGSPAPAEIEAEIEAAAEADPMLDAKGEPAPLPEAMPADSAAAAPIRMDARGRAVRKVAAERANLEALAAGCRIDSKEVAKMGNARLRKAVLKVAAPNSRQDGSRDYDRATIDHLAAGRRTDSAADPYAALAQPGADHREDARNDDFAPVDPLARYARREPTEPVLNRYARA